MDHGTHREQDNLTDLLEREPGRFEPVTALRIAQTASSGDLDICAPIALAPAPIAVSSYERHGPRRRIRALFANVTGPVGSLPHAYNELVLREERNRSRALSAFFDLFNSRLAELFADASEKYRLARRLRWQGAREKKGFVKALLSLTGFGTRRLRSKAVIDQELLIRFSGILADRTRHAAGLRAMIGELTGLPVAIDQFRPRWLSIPREERTKMERKTVVRLGFNTTAGTAYRDLSGAFRIVIGPVGYSDYQRFTPGGRFIREVVALTRLYVGPHLDFDVQIVLRREDVPMSCLAGSTGPRLGWNSWARVAPAADDSRDAVIAARTIERRIAEDSQCTLS